MAGLLGDGWSDPQSNAIMQLAGGLLSGNFGQGAAAYGATMAGAKDADLKRKMTQMQMDNYTSEIEARKLAGIKDARQQSLMESFFPGMGSGSAAAAPKEAMSPGAFVAPVDGTGPVMPQQAQAAPAQNGILALAQKLGIPPEAIQTDMVFNGGKKISEMLAERSKPNWQNINGNLVNTSAQGFSGGLQGGMSSSADGKVTAWQPDGKGGLVVGAPAGAIDTFKAYQGAGSRFKPMKVYNPETGRDEFISEGAALDGQPGALPNSATTPGSWQAKNPGANIMAPRPGESDQPKIYADALAAARHQLTLARTPEDEARAKSDIAGIQGEMRRAGMPVPMRPAGNFAAGPSNAEKLSNDAGGKINESWLKTSYEPVIASIGPINDTLTSIKVARGAIDKMGGTGWGTETKATAASVLSGLGLSSGNSKMYAANAQVFQNAAMERLQSVLNQATGPQTDQDATRASQTFAKLGNVTEANKFILDLAEAKAQRDKLKADFYQKALPIAQQKGNLQEIDREWSKRAPSIFNMPSMTAWGIK